MLFKVNSVSQSTRQRSWTLCLPLNLILVVVLVEGDVVLVARVVVARQEFPKSFLKGLNVPNPSACILFQIPTGTHRTLKQHREVKHDKDLLGLRVWVTFLVLLPLIDIVDCCLDRGTSLLWLNPELVIVAAITVIASARWLRAFATRIILLNHGVAVLENTLGSVLGFDVFWSPASRGQQNDQLWEHPEVLTLSCHPVQH